MTKNHAHHGAVGELRRRVHRTPFTQYYPTTTDRCIVGYAAIDMLPDELLLEIFDSRLRTLENWEKPEYWEKLVHVCQRWRSIVFSAPLRLRLRLACTSRTPVRQRLYIWPKLPIILHVIGSLYEIADNIIAALEHHDRIYVID